MENERKGKRGGKRRQRGGRRQGENQQEEVLLADDNIEAPIETPKLPDHRKYIPFLPKIYWFFYRKPLYFLAFLPSFLTGFVSIGTTISLALIIDAINKENGLQLIKKYAFYQFIAAIGNGVLSLLSRYSWNQINDLIRIKMKRVVFKSMMMKDIEFFDERSFGDLLTVLEDEVRKAEGIFSFGKARQISSVGNIISGLMFCFSIEWRLTLFAVIITFCQSRITKAFSTYGREQMKAGFKANSKSTTIAAEVISNIRTVFSFSCQHRELDHYTEECTEYCERNAHSKIFFSTSGQISTIMNRGALCVFLNFGSWLCLKGSLTPGFLFSLSTEAFRLAREINSLVSSFANEQRYLESADKIFEIIDLAPSVPFTNEGKEIQNFSGRIEFKDVWFKYPTRNAWVLKNVSFVVEPGEITAFVGHSGSGKSTILQLILRFYDASSGQILFDGVDIRELDPRWIHRVMSVVQQDPCLFSVSIRENVLYGLDDSFYRTKFGMADTSYEAIENNPQVDREIDRCLDIAQALHFVSELPNKKDTLVGEKGAKLSGGQKQRIAIARAVIRDPIVMITDEATSALDAENESKVQKALDLVMQGRTSIIIAHRLGTIKGAKTIYVFDSGELLESGSRDELIQKRGAFYNLVERQLNLNSV